MNVAVGALDARTALYYPTSIEGPQGLFLSSTQSFECWVNLQNSFSP